MESGDEVPPATPPPPICSEVSGGSSLPSPPLPLTLPLGTSNPRSQEKLGRYNKFCIGSSRSSRLRNDFRDSDEESKLRESDV